MNKTCTICGHSDDLYFFTTGKDDESEQHFLCGKCWNIIAEIAKRVAKDLINKLQEKK